MPCTNSRSLQSPAWKIEVHVSNFHFCWINAKSCINFTNDMYVIKTCSRRYIISTLSKRRGYSICLWPYKGKEHSRALDSNFLILSRGRPATWSMMERATIYSCCCWGLGTLGTPTTGRILVRVLWKYKGQCRSATSPPSYIIARTLCSYKSIFHLQRTRT